MRGTKRRGTKRRVTKRRHAKNCKCYRCRNAIKGGATKRRVKTCNKRSRHVMKGG